MDFINVIKSLTGLKFPALRITGSCVSKKRWLGMFSIDLLIVGIGDIGKMEGQDAPKKGAPITSQAIEVILKRSVGVNES